MRVLFEHGDWQIITLDDNIAYIRHYKCHDSLFSYYLHSHRCTCCSMVPPERIQTLRILYNWDII